MRYRRSLSSTIVALLLPQAPLGFLIRDYRQWVPTDPFALDLQLREGNVLQFYHGSSSLLTISVAFNGSSLSCSAAASYAAIPGFQELMGRWTSTDWKRLATLIPFYLSVAVQRAGNPHYRTFGKGYWHNRLALNWGISSTADQPWLVFDREVVFGFDNEEARQAFQGPIQTRYLAAHGLLSPEASTRWGGPVKGLGNEMGFLALGSSGELVIVELKTGSDAAGVYWGPLQVSRYREFLREAVPHIWPDVLTLVRQKIRMGLLPTFAAERLISSGPPRIEAALVVADPPDQPSYSANAVEVTRRCVEVNVTWYELREVALSDHRYDPQ